MRFVDDARDEGMKEETLLRVQMAEKMAGFEFEVTSGFREGDEGCHGRGEAVDIRCGDSTKRYEVVRALFKAGFERIGVYDRHVHCDTCVTEMPRGVLWMGVSR